MSRPDYKGPARKETARRVRERSDSVNPSRGLDEALDDRIERDDDRWSCGHEPDWVDGLCAGCWVEDQQALERYRAALEEIANHALHAGRPEVDDFAHEVYTVAAEALKVPDPSSGGNQGRGPDRSPSSTERKGVDKEGA